VMGIKNLPRIAEGLMAHGRAGTTPVALVRWGTTPEQEVLTATLETVAAQAAAAHFAAPAIIVVGEVVSLRGRLSWYERARPLLGRNIWITRSRVQASDLATQLLSFGARVEEIPTIAIVPVVDEEPLLSAVKRLASYDWVVFTSVNGVDAFFDVLRRTDRDARACAGVQVAAIGPATARRLAQNGITADLVPEAFRAEKVLEALVEEGVGAGVRVLIPRAKVARELLPDGLRDAGATVDVVAAYETVPAAGTKAVKAAARALLDGDFPAVTFSSSSTVRNFVSLVGAQLLEDPHYHSCGKQDAGKAAAQATAQAFARCGTKVFSIGPITSQTVLDQGLTLTAEAGEYTILGLVQAIYDYYVC
jgi:uroporphyrinogen III methyltransferase/synthase